MSGKPKVLLVGHGAREHVIAESLKKSDIELFSFMGSKNPGIDALSEKIQIGNLNDFEKLNNFIQSINLDFAIIGPESPLGDGISDKLAKVGIPSVGPRKEPAKLEISKAFCRKLTTKYKIPGTPKYIISSDLKEIKSFLDEVGEVAVKPDGLTGGKGVKISGEHLMNTEEILEYSKELINTTGKVIIEEKLEGEEFTLQAFVDGTHVIGTPLVQDHKRLLNDDRGPNTGGMGSYSCSDHKLPFVDNKTIEQSLEIMKKTIKCVKTETNFEYKGILYGQFMLTRDGPKLVEYNVRFGDPEAMNVLPILKNNFLEICERIIDGKLNRLKIEFKNKATVVKYLAPNGYPIDAKPTEVIVDQKAVEREGAKLYYASVHKDNGKIITTKSRSIGVLGIANKLENAEQIAENSIKYIKGDLYHRSDVGTLQILNKRINNMKKILGV
ncbi:MAG: phosphoribosylamine--glycine ligase [Candidatus Helarchaeota archaeon]